VTDPPREALAVHFDWRDAAEQCADFAARFVAARAEPNGRAFVDPATGARLWVPLVLSPPRPGELPHAYALRAPMRPGRVCVLLLRAGAAALGWSDDGELVRHKAQKRYVVRGHGRAQPAHQRQQGPSRYGARLRLQNWRRLLAEVNGRLRAWWDELGEPEQVLFSVPVRSLADLFAADPAPPIGRDDARLRRIPLHVHEPDHKELRRVHALLLRGRLEIPAG
jgi:hypothetical protein